MILERVGAGVLEGGPLRDSERKVARIVMQRPHAVVSMTIGALADEAEVSEPTVIRFCRALGCHGFQDFKLRLAENLAGGVPHAHADLSPDDPLAEVAAKVLGQAAAALTQARLGLDSQALEQAVALIRAARRIEFYGFGASGIVAQDAQHKFMRLGLPTVAISDFHIQSMAAAMLGSAGVAIAISHTGRTAELLRSVERAMGGGASVIAVTEPGSPLARIATVTLGAEVPPDGGLFSPMAGRLVHLAVLDVLQVAVALRAGHAPVRTAPI